MWSWTNPRSTICGLYQVSMWEMRLGLREDPPATQSRVQNALDELAAKPLVKWDPEHEVIWVVNRVRYANRSPKVARAMQKEVERAPTSPLVVEFVEKYGAQLGIEIGGT